MTADLAYRDWVPCPTSPAVFSADRTRRYELVRVRRRPSSEVRSIGVVGVNPSVASETVWDRTIKKLCRLCDRWGFNRLVMTNLFPLVSTDPMGLLSWTGGDVDDEIDLLVRSLAHVETILCAWGGPYHPKRLRDLVAYRAQLVERRLRAEGCKLHVLQFSNDGIPRHVLYLPETLQPVVWDGLQRMAVAAEDAS